MLFAAGFGTRMGALTADRPKPLIEVAGKTLLDHALDLAKAEGLRCIVNVHYKGEMIAEHLKGQDVQISDESVEILETGGGLKQALPLLQSNPVITMNTDAVWSGPNPLRTLLDAWDGSKMDALLLCIPLNSAIGHTGKGDFLIGEDGTLTRGPGLVYSGVQIIKTYGLADISDTAFSLNVLWNRIAETDRLYGVPYSGRWCDVGHPAGITEAEAMLRADV